MAGGGKIRVPEFGRQVLARLMTSGGNFGDPFANALENTVLDVIIPGGILNKGGRVRCRITFQINGTGTKFMRVYFGGTKMIEVDLNQNANRNWKADIDVFSEGGPGHNGVEFHLVGNTNATATPPIAGATETVFGQVLQDQTIDETLDQHFKVTIQKGVAGDTYTPLNFQAWLEADQDPADQ